MAATDSSGLFSKALAGYTFLMGILDRLGNVIKSHINYDDGKSFGGTHSSWRSSTRRGDPDLDAAYAELDDLLNNDSSGSARGKWNADFREREKSAAKPIPDDIKQAFSELGLTTGASAEDCKEAYKKLLKIHHPDRHARHSGNMRKATVRAARVNNAYERLREWFRGEPSGK